MQFNAIQCNVINAFVYAANFDPDCQAFGRPRRLPTRSLWMMTTSTSTRILASSVLTFGRRDWPRNIISHKCGFQTFVVQSLYLLDFSFHSGSCPYLTNLFQDQKVFFLYSGCLVAWLPGEGQHHFWHLALFKVICYFPNGKSTIWGICREYFLLGPLWSKSEDNVIITDDVAEADKFVAKWKALSEAGPFWRGAHDGSLNEENYDLPVNCWSSFGHFEATTYFDTTC